MLPDTGEAEPRRGPITRSDGFGAPGLSIVIPAFNATRWLNGTIRQLTSELNAAGWVDAKIIIVDDGSDDDPAGEVTGDLQRRGVTVIRQANAGRFVARWTGLRAATGEYTLLLDSRVHLATGAMTFLRDQLQAHPERRVWNGHVHTAESRSPTAYFWDAITHIAWRRYYRRPRTVGFGADEFDYYPKGTGMFLAPTGLLLRLCDQFASGVADLRDANDDTLLLRPLVEQERIFISPEFACTYHAREELRAFVAHTYHRGKVLIDGHLRPGTRLRRPILAAVGLSPVVVAVALARPKWIIPGWVAISGFLAAVSSVARTPRRAVASLALLWPLFSACYLSGMLVALWNRRRAVFRTALPTPRPGSQ